MPTYHCKACSKFGRRFRTCQLNVLVYEDEFEGIQVDNKPWLCVLRPSMISEWELIE